MPEPEDNRGSGVSIEDPYRLAATHPMLGVVSQKMLISRVYGEQNKDWFDAGRVYHPNKICEQQIRLPSGQIRKVFFDESALDYAIPIPSELRPALQQAAANIPVPDTRLVSRFPLIEVKATSAADAARIIVAHLNKAKREGWIQGQTSLFVDGWRNDVQLTRGGEKTVMSFDMRPALLADSQLNLMMFSALDSFEAVDEVVRRMEAMKTPSNVVEVDSRRVLVTSLKFSSIAAVVGGLIGFFLSRLFEVAFVTAAVAFIATLIWCQKAIRDEAAARGLELRIRRGSDSQKT